MKLYSAYKAVGIQGENCPLGTGLVCMLYGVLLSKFWEEILNKYLPYLFISPTENYLRQKDV
jgi:hypothetical protein